MASPVRRVAIIGAGAAGLTTAEALRDLGFVGTIVLIGGERHVPYDRPPLSKQILAGRWEPQQSYLRTHESYDELGIELRLSTTAVAIDSTLRCVMLSDGDSINYDALVIATGSRARVLADMPDDDRVHHFRTVDDAVALRLQLQGQPRTLILGAGVLGLELAATIRELGSQVHVIDPLPSPMLRQFGPTIGDPLVQLHAEHGVDLTLGVDVQQVVHGRDGAIQINLIDGTSRTGELLVVAVGSKPNIEWLAGSGLPTADGVLTDGDGRVQDNVFAVGDVAARFDMDAQRHVRSESRTAAGEHGWAAAAAIMNLPAPPPPSRYFWTDQYSTKIQGVGRFTSDTNLDVVDGDLHSGRFVATCSLNGRLRGVVGWNLPRPFAKWRAKLTSETPSSPKTVTTV